MDGKCGCRAICDKCGKCAECCECRFCEGCSEWIDTDGCICENCEMCENCCECYTCEECGNRFNREHMACVECCRCEDCECTCETEEPQWDTQECIYCNQKYGRGTHCATCNHCPACCYCGKYTPKVPSQAETTIGFYGEGTPLYKKIRRALDANPEKKDVKAKAKPLFTCVRCHEKFSDEDICNKCWRCSNCRCTATCEKQRYPSTVRTDSGEIVKVYQTGSADVLPPEE